MDPEEIRLLRLTRAGKETIIKCGTYDMIKARAIVIADHPFYDHEAVASENTLDCIGNDDYASYEEPVAEVNEEALLSSIVSSNFKVGLSQEEVDALLSGMAI